MNTTWLYIPIFLLFLTIFLNKFQKAQIIRVDDETGPNDYVDISPDEKKIKGLVAQNPGPYKGIAGQNNMCKRPTEDNPFMNVLLSDYESNPTTGPACSLEDQEISEEARDEFNKNLFRDVNDMYEKENSQRTYYSMPSTTIPNDQKAFAEWCYGVPETCKTNSRKCLRYEDLRNSRRISPYEYVI